MLVFVGLNGFDIGIDRLKLYFYKLLIDFRTVHGKTSPLGFLAISWHLEVGEEQVWVEVNPIRSPTLLNLPGP